MEAWYKIAEPRKEVRKGRSFTPDEFIVLFQKVGQGAAFFCLSNAFSALYPKAVKKNESWTLCS